MIFPCIFHIPQHMLPWVMFMKWKTYGFWIALAEGVGLLSGYLSREAQNLYSEFIHKPPLSPPAILFPIVWTILYALMGIGIARVRLKDGEGKKRATGLFLLQLTVNFFWSLIFFNAQAFALAFLWLVLLWVAVYGMIRQFAKDDALSAKLQIPYLLWLTFAAYLNAGVFLLNR